MSPEVAGHVGVHVAEAVEGAKGQVKQEAPQKGEVPPYLKIGAQQSFKNQSSGSKGNSFLASENKVL